jgi:ABC-type lipoprotein export system ATPase subunit
MIRCEQLTKTYATRSAQVRALDQVNLAVQAGEFLCIRGPSGCGKTTLLLTLGGLLRPSSGRVVVDGADLYALSPGDRARFRAAKIGFVFQMFHLVPYLTVAENVLLAAGGGLGPSADSKASEGAPSEVAAEGLKAGRQTERGMFGVRASAWSARAVELLTQLGLGARVGHKPGELSAGERQRTALARALLNQPQLLLADEPTGNLDPDNAAAVFEHLRAFHRAGGTVVVVTHGAVAEPYATRVCQMRAGAVVWLRVEG